MRFRSLPPWLVAGVTAFQLVALLVLEGRRPLRPATEDKTLRDRRNLIVAATAALPVALIETPIARGLSVIAQRKRWGLLQVFGCRACSRRYLQFCCSIIRCICGTGSPIARLCCGAFTSCTIPIAIWT